MKSRSNPFLALALVVASSATLQAALYWNANSGTPDYSGTWDEVTNNWNTASAGAGTQTTWIPAGDAEFDVAQTYTVTGDAAQTAANLNIKAGAVTFSGTSTVSSNNLTIDTGASLTAASDRFLKVGTTTLIVNGTLTQTAAVGLNTQRVSLAGGNGSIVFSGGLRTAGNFDFAGNLSGTGSILTDAGGTFTLSGTNTFAGDLLLRSANILRIGSAAALSPNAFIRTGGGSVFELTFGDFSRPIAASGAGNMRVGNPADVSASTFGFAAVNADRDVALTGTVLWGSTSFNPSTLNLGTAASTHKANLTTDIDLNAGNRTLGSINGSADIEGEVSGVISGAPGSILTKTGTGILLLSKANTHPGGTVIAGSQGAINPLRISNAGAAGTGVLTIGSGGNNDRSRLELTGGITVANSIPALTSRSSTNDAPNIVNISGNNTISSNISAGGGGDRTTIESAADKLTLGGSVSVRRLNLFGEGEGEISGNVANTTGYILNKAGAGKWTIGGNLTNGTGVTIAEGTLQIGNGGATGSLGVAPAIINDGALIFDRTGAVAIPGAISGVGTITKRGSSIITLSAANSYTGTTSVEAGSLLIHGDHTAATGATSVNAGAGLGGDGFIDAATYAAGAEFPWTVADWTGAPSLDAGAVTIEGALTVVLGESALANFTEANTSFTILSASSLTVTNPAALAVDATGFTSGTGSWAVQKDGNTLKLVYAAGAAGGYTAWAATNGVPGQSGDLDHDNDGVSNGVEYFIGGPTGNTTGFTALPSVTTSAGVRSITWTKAATYTGVYNTDFTVETSSTLATASWTTEASPGTVTISGNDVTYTFPAGPVKNFARLKVTGP